MKPAALLTAVLAVGVAAVLVLLLRSPQTTRDTARHATPTAPGAPAREAHAPDEGLRVASETRAAPGTATDAPATARVPGPEPAAEVRAQPPAWRSTPQSLWGWVRGPAGALAGARVALVDEERGEVASVATADDGSFQLALPSAVDGALLRITHAGHAPFEKGPYRVRAGEKRQVGVLRLSAAVPLSGRVTGPDGQPLAGATVTVSGAAGAGSPNRHRHVVRTDRDGAFHVPDGPGRGVRVEARAEGYATRTVGPLNPPLAEPLVVALEPAEALVVEVRGPAGPLPGAAVRVVVDGRSGPSFTGETDREGRVRFDGVPDGSWTGTASAPGHLEGRFRGPGPRAVVELDALACVRGRVRAPRGAALPANTRVLLIPAGAEHRREDDRYARVEPDGEGRFELCGVEPGRWVLRAHADGFAPSASPPFAVEREDREVDVHLVVGGTLEARVGDDSGAVEGVEVSLVARPLGTAGPGAAPLGLRDVLATARTDAAGIARFEHVAPREHWIVLRHPDYAHETAGPWVPRERERPALAVVHLEPGVVLAGTVHGPDGRPAAARVVVHALDDAGRRVLGEWSAGADGRYRTTPCPRGRYEITATSALGEAHLELAVEPGETPRADLFLSP